MKFAPKKPQIKGKIFPSFYNQQAQKPRMVRIYAESDSSLDRRMRRLRQQTASILDSKDPRVLVVTDRVLKYALEEPDTEYTCLNLVAGGMAEAEGSGDDWPTAMTRILDEFDKTKAGKQDAEEEPETTAEQPSILSRLLRAFTPRALRASDEDSPGATER